MPQSAQVQWFGEQVKAQLRAAAVEGIGLATEHWLGQARQEVPLEEGTLERSGVTSIDGDKLTGAVSFDTKYAVRQHEDPDLRHDEGRKWKYLEDPGNREAPTMVALMAVPLRRAFGEGFSG